MPQTIRDRRQLANAKAARSQEMAREVLERIRDEALAVSDEDLARQAEVAGAVDWTRLGQSLHGRMAVRLLAEAADQAAPDSSYLTTGEASEALGVSINTLKKWVRLGLIRDAYRTGGGHLRVAAGDVARIARLNRELEQSPDLRAVESQRPPPPWTR